MRPTVSIVVTTYNWKEALSLCLDSIASQNVLPIDVVVADDGSRPDTAKLIEHVARGFPTPLIHAWQADQGFRAARVRNLGISLSRGEYVIFVDGDMVLHPLFVADHLALIRPGSYLQGGRLNASRKYSERLLGGLEPQFSPFTRLARHVGGELKSRHALRIPVLARIKAAYREGGVAMSCNLGAWRSDLQRVNGFNNEYVGWGREDADLTLRLRNAGVRRRLLRYSALAIHLWHENRWPNGLSPSSRLPNDSILDRTRQAFLTRCNNGLDAVSPAQGESARR